MEGVMWAMAHSSHATVLIYAAPAGKLAVSCADIGGTSREGLAVLIQ